MNGPIAQRLEQGTHNPLVPGSNPGGPKEIFDLRLSNADPLQRVLRWLWTNRAVRSGGWCQRPSIGRDNRWCPAVRAKVCRASRRTCVFSRHLIGPSGGDSAAARGAMGSGSAMRSGSRKIRGRFLARRRRLWPFTGSSISRPRKRLFFGVCRTECRRDNLRGASFALKISFLNASPLTSMAPAPNDAGC